jgi:hypothetical protein
MSAPFDEWLRESRRRTEDRLDISNSPTTSKGRNRDLLERPLGQKAAEPLLERLAAFLAGKLEQRPDLPPKWLDSIIFNHRMKPEMLAIMALAPLLNAIDRGHLARRDEDDERGPERALKQTSEQNSRAVWRWRRPSDPRAQPPAKLRGKSARPARMHGN